VVPENPVIPLEDAVKGLGANIPNAEWLLKHIESQEGWFRFPAYITNLITNLRLESYPLLYVSESAIGAAVFLGFMTKEELQDLGAKLDHATLEERSEFLAELDDLLSEFVEGFHIPRTPAEQEAARNRFLALSEDEQRQSVKVSQHFFLSFLPAFHQCLSIMVHGEKLTSLVAQAQSGDDDAFVRAVQIDRRILTEMPYFKSRYALAQNEEKGSDFFDKLAYRLKSPPYRGKIRHKTLWWTFSILEQAGWLNDLPHRQLLDICDEAGVGGYENRIQSEKHLGARLREYREFQKRGIVTTT
jgi:hypothetical protein